MLNQWLSLSPVKHIDRVNSSQAVYGNINIKYMYMYIFFHFVQAAKKSGNGILSQWVPAIRNHFWDSAKESQGDVDKMKVQYIIEDNIIK